MSTAELTRIELNTSSAQEKKASLRERISLIGWRIGFIGLGLALNTVALFFAAMATGKVAENFAKAQSEGISVPVIIQCLLIGLIPFMVLGPLGVILGSKLSNHRRPQAAQVLATVGAVILTCLFMLLGLCGFANLGDPTAHVWMNETMCACCVLNAVCQILAARMIVKRAATPVVPAGVHHDRNDTV